MNDSSGCLKNGGLTWNVRCSPTTPKPNSIARSDELSVRAIAAEHAQHYHATKDNRQQLIQMQNATPKVPPGRARLCPTMNPLARCFQTRNHRMPRSNYSSNSHIAKAHNRLLGYQVMMSADSRCLAEQEETPATREKKVFKEIIPDLLSDIRIT